MLPGPGFDDSHSKKFKCPKGIIFEPEYSVAEEVEDREDLTHTLLARAPKKTKKKLKNTYYL